MKTAFAITADIWALLAWTIANVNEYLLTVSTSLAIISSLIVLIPWLINKGWKTWFKKTSIILLLATSFAGNAQITLSVRTPVTPSDTSYIPIPVPPAFTDSAVITQGVTGTSINLADTQGKFQLLFGSNYTTAQLNGLSGNYYLKSQNWNNPTTWAKLGSSGQSAAINNAVATPGVFLFNVFAQNSGNNIRSFPSPDSGPHKPMYYQNLIVRNSFFANFLLNDDVVGESYGKTIFNFIRGRKSNTGELLYCGNTGNQISTYEDSTFAFNIFGDSIGREGLQFNGHKYLYVDKVTILHSGLDSTAGTGQNLFGQFQNIKTGVIKNFLAIDCRAPMMVASQNITFDNFFLGWRLNTREIYFQNMRGNGYTKYMNPGGTIRVSNGQLYNPGYSVAWVFRLQQDSCNYVFENLILPAGATQVYKDERPNPSSGTITVINCTFSDVVNYPELQAPPLSDASYRPYEQVVKFNSYWYLRQAGYRTPPVPTNYDYHILQQ